jgi:hypothetical protein
MNHPDYLEQVGVASMVHLNATAIRELKAPLLIVKTQKGGVGRLAVIVPIEQYERMIANERTTGSTGEPDSSH